jgi:hypothetical protein
MTISGRAAIRSRVVRQRYVKGMAVTVLSVVAPRCVSHGRQAMSDLDAAGVAAPKCD